MRKENCQNCRKYLKLMQFDYKPTGGVDHIEKEGYICLVFASEGDAIWMTGLKPEESFCEEYAPKN